MATNSKQAISTDTKTTASIQELAPIKTSRDFAKCMSVLMHDLSNGTISPGIANAICNAGGKLLKVFELELKYGIKEKTANIQEPLSPISPKSLQLIE